MCDLYYSVTGVWSVKCTIVYKLVLHFHSQYVSNESELLFLLSVTTTSCFSTYIGSGLRNVSGNTYHSVPWPWQSLLLLLFFHCRLAPSLRMTVCRSLITPCVLSWWYSDVPGLILSLTCAWTGVCPLRPSGYYKPTDGALPFIARTFCEFPQFSPQKHLFYVDVRASVERSAAVPACDETNDRSRGRGEGGVKRLRQPSVFGKWCQMTSAHNGLL